MDKFETIHSGEEDITKNKEKPAETISSVLKGFMEDLKIEPSIDLSLLTNRKVIKIDATVEKACQTFKINELEIKFPYNYIYEPQKEYMKKVIETIKDGKNALLQSPTGTGKTMSLLCATMAWLKKFQEKCLEEGTLDLLEETKVIYATRTNTQVKQIVNQLKKSCYRPITCILGSRNQSCLKNKETGFLDENKNYRRVSGGQLITACKSARTALFADPPVEDEYKCKYFLPFNTSNSSFFDAKKVQNPILEYYKTDKIRDIEDLHELGAKCGFCPMYFERYILADSDIIVMPYNYLLDPTLRTMSEINLRNKIIIIDEAHNIERAAEEGVSFELTIKHLEAALNDIFGFINTLKSQSRNIPPFVVAGLKMVETLQENMRILGNHFVAKEQERISPGREILELFDNVPPNDKTTYETQAEKIKAHVQNVFDTLFELVEFMGDIPRFFGGGGVSYLVRGMKIINRLSTRDFELQSNPEKKRFENYIEAYRLFYIIPEKNADLVLKLQCLDPSICFEDIIKENPRSLILTSGTLEPMKSFEEQLKVSFPIQLINNHIIDTKQQCQTMIIPKGLKNQKVSINFTFKESENLSIYQEVGSFLITLAKLVKNGMLVVFASYRIMHKCFEVWEKEKILDEDITYLEKLEELKPIYKEPKDGFDLREVMEEYFEDAQTEKGAILCCVCRGKISEGIDFADEKARAVVLVGVPLLSSQALEVKAKKDYLDQKPGLSGKDWYNQQAIRAFNQAIGRVIRHKDDYGMVFLFDDRYLYAYNKDLPNWVKDNVHKIEKEGDFIMKIHKFFSNATKLALERKPPENENTDVLEELDEAEEWAPTRTPSKTSTDNDLFFNGAKRKRNRNRNRAGQSNNNINNRYQYPNPLLNTQPLKRKTDYTEREDLKNVKKTPESKQTQTSLFNFFTQTSQNVHIASSQRLSYSDRKTNNKTK